MRRECREVAVSEQAPVAAPEFPSDLEWINTTRPLRMVDLRGRFVILDFWTYCCVNCLQLTSQLRKLERKYADILTVVGIHTPKFIQERQSANIRVAVRRHRIEHPVANDHEFAVWRTYGVRAWPTLMVIDPRGDVLGRHEGEATFETLDAFISGLIPIYRGDGSLKPARLDITSSPNKVGTGLAFPGKVLITDQGRLFIADSGHHRIVEATLDGEVQRLIGSGIEGDDDGPAHAATFAYPQGLALTDNQLWIADTENHCLRVADLGTGRVTTAAGTGVRGYGIDAPTPGLHAELASPWDLAAVGERLFIANAGSHQIWMYDIDLGIIAVHAGSGREGLRDGPAAEAWLAQPSGLARRGDALLVADSEVSAIRQVGTGTDATVGTVVGKDLFEFGDVDGEGDAVRLQHALGIASGAAGTFVADTFNNKIKTLDVEARRATTFAGSAEPGYVDGALEDARFFEPGGLALADGRLFVADTNNHVIRVIDLNAKQVSTLNLRGLS